MPTVDLNVGTEGAKRSVQELTAVVDQLEAKLKSVAGTLGASSTPADTANFFSAASQLGSARAQLNNAISGSASPAGSGTPFGGADNPFGSPSFKMQRLGDVQAASAFVMQQNLSSGAKEALLSQVLKGSVPMAIGEAPAPPSHPFNPFYGADPTGPSTPLKSPGWQRLQYDYDQQQQQAQAHALGMKAIGVAGGYQAAQFIAGTAGAYTSSVTSGQADPLAFGAVYGGAAGFAIGAGIGAFAGPLGAVAGGLIGSTVGAPLVNALQARSVANMQIAQSLVPMAAQNGLDPMAVTQSANAIAQNYNNRKENDAGISWERGERRSGTYAGIDQASPQDAAAVMASLSGGYLQSGIDPNSRNLSGETAALITRYGGKGAASVAASQARVQAASAATDNPVDMMQRVGLPDMLTVYNRPDERAALIYASGAIARKGYETGIATSVSEGGRSSYDSSVFGGGSTRSRSGGFSAMISGMEGVAGALSGELAAIEAAPGGKDSALAATKRALLSAAKAEIQAEYGRRAQGIIGDIEAGSGVGVAGANAGLSRANLYGDAGDFAKPTAALGSALQSEAAGLSQALSLPGVTYQDSMRLRARITEIGQQIQALPAAQAASEFGRRNLSGDVRAANQGVLSAQAGLYGGINEIEAAGGATFAIQQGIYNDALLTVNNPNASVETRGAAAMRADNASVAALQARAGTRGAVINRIQQSSAANQSELFMGMTQAQFGSGADVRMASAGMLAAFQSESDKLTAQISAPGTTVEQKLSLRQQIAGLQSQSISLTESARDSGFQKDFISKYEVQATKLAGQAQRQELLPFNPGNMMNTSLQMLQNNQVALKMLGEREADLKKAGTYSPERQLEIETQRQGLLTADAQQIAFLGNDLPNRLPAMAAGKPSGSFRFNSFELAALAVQGTATRSFGAVGGGQLRNQDAFTAPFVSEGEIRPRSRTQALNNGGGDGAVVAAIEKLIAVVQSSGGAKSGMRPNEGVGAIASAVYGKRANLDNGK